jgi:hypothetical protein
VPGTFGLEGAMVDQALHLTDRWEQVDEDYKIQSFHLQHLNVDQRWFVVWSKGALERGVSTLNKRSEKKKQR